VAQNKLGIASIAGLKSHQGDVVIGALTARPRTPSRARARKLRGLAAQIVTAMRLFGGPDRLRGGEVDGLFTHEGSVANTRPT